MMLHPNEEKDIKRLKEQMQRLGLGENDLARLCEVSPGAVRHWMRGIRRIGGLTFKILDVLERHPHLRPELIKPRGFPKL